jgi:hypothetical protein
MNLYHDWIKRNVDDPLGQCRHFCELMKKEFPELTMVRGHYICWSWGRRQHWWLTTPDGEIVDPTVDQFPHPHLGDYEPWIEGSPEPTGTCMNCGEQVFAPRHSICSDKCETAFVKWQKGG